MVKKKFIINIIELDLLFELLSLSTQPKSSQAENTMKNKCKLLTTLLTVLAFLITLTYCTGDANTNNDESTALITDAATYDKATVNGVPISKFVIVHDGETLSKR